MTIDVTEREGVAELLINRPEKRNALRDEDAAELLAAVSAAGGSARAVLIRGEGQAFCAGRDLAGADPGSEDGGQVLATVISPLIGAIAAVEVPTIAAVQGACLGAGLGIALACDLMIAAEDARIGSPFARIGAVLDSGAHYFLFHRIGPARLLQLMYTGRLLSGREATEWGLAAECCPAAQLADRARELAAQLAGGPTAAFRLSKRLVQRLGEEPMSLADVLAAEASAQSAASATADYVEGITAFQERRPPRFRGE